MYDDKPPLLAYYIKCNLKDSQKLTFRFKMKAYNVSGYILGTIDYSCSMATKPIPSPCCCQVKSFLRHFINH